MTILYFLCGSLLAAKMSDTGSRVSIPFSPLQTSSMDKEEKRLLQGTNLSVRNYGFLLENTGISRKMDSKTYLVWVPTLN